MSTIISPITTFGCLKISGTQAKDFLQGQLTCDVNTLTKDNILLSAYCNERGRITATGYLMQVENTYYFFTPKNLIAHTEQKFRQYGIFSSIQITQDDTFSMLACMGTLPNINLPNNTLERIRIEEKVYAACLNTNTNLYCIIGEKLALATLQDNITKNQYAKLFIDLHYWDRANIQAGIVHVYVSTLEKLTPHMINYHKHSALCFDKGCFLGQEVIARTQHRGRVKRKLYQLSIPKSRDILPGSQVEGNGETAGIIVAEYSTKETGTTALAVISEHAIKSKLNVGEYSASIETLTESSFQAA